MESSFNGHIRLLDLAGERIKDMSAEITQREIKVKKVKLKEEKEQSIKSCGKISNDLSWVSFSPTKRINREQRMIIIT